MDEIIYIVVGLLGGIPIGILTIIILINKDEKRR